ncbi:putative pentatricopeptide [Rosa chinensis]|uniref:Putative pentatricopeptide n=1 Tax=Rosa chinensis TaxID=74649 RepID=A0A2P6S9J7_ROSCH|nr:putative pentatricopeptide [Rosa chinensis]
MYFKCGDEVDARKVFDKMFVRNLYSWNNMLSGYAKMRNLKEARSLFDKMPERDVVSWNLRNSL